MEDAGVRPVRPVGRQLADRPVVGRVAGGPELAIEADEVTADIGYPTPGSFGSRYGVDLGLEVVTLEIPAVGEDQAWVENREALRVALDLL